MTTTPTAATNPANTVDDGRDAVIEQAIAHTCFDGDDFDGTLTDGCAGCEQARCYPCGYCGYGRTFPTHNAQAHQDGCDPMAPANLADVSEAWANSPHRADASLVEVSVELLALVPTYSTHTLRLTGEQFEQLRKGDLDLDTVVDFVRQAEGKEAIPGYSACVPVDSAAWFTTTSDGQTDEDGMVPEEVHDDA